MRTVEDRRAFAHERFGLGSSSFERVDGGWAYETYLADEGWIVQFPALEGEDLTLRRQMEVLPELAREVSAAIPTPEFVSDDPPAMAYRRIEGAPFTQAPDGIWPERLGRFLYDLHMAPPEFVGLRATTAEAVRARLREQVEGFAPILELLDADERQRAQEMFAAYLDDDANWRFATCLTHGDLGPEHILVTPAGDLAGVIDWGDVSVGDPVWDFAWLLHGAREAGERALGAYGGEPDPRFRDRARWGFALMPWHEVDYGLRTDRPGFVRSGLAGVRARLF